jgi:tRNA nucleotidyltransferase/poly(A) polymerase
VKTYEQFTQKQNNMKIPNDILEIAEKFYNANKEIYLVGGCVRDFLLNKNPKDFDLVTNALPNEIKNILKDYRTDLQGEHFGVVRVFTEETPLGIEIATFRKDIYD